MRELTRRLRAGEGAPPPVLALVFRPLPAAADFFLLGLLPVAALGSGVGGSATQRSIVRNRSLQHGHLFSVSAHLSMHSKQKRWVQPLMEATSAMEGGASRQMAQVKSAGGFSSAPATMTPPTTGFAAGLRSQSSSPLSLSLSSSSRTMGVSLVPRVADDDDDDDDVVTVPLVRSTPLRAADVVRLERLSVPCAAWAISVEARTAAVRVDRGLLSVVAVVAAVPPEKEGEATVSEAAPMSRRRRATRWELLMDGINFDCWYLVGRFV